MRRPAVPGQAEARAPGHRPLVSAPVTPSGNGFTSGIGISKLLCVV